jgi:hypothetical protein
MMAPVIGFLLKIMRRPHWSAEAWSALVLVGWGVWNLAAPMRLQDAANYDIALKMFPTPLLELIAIVFGFGQIGALLLDKLVLRLIAAFACCLVYSMFCSTFLLSPSIPPGTVFVMGWVGVNMYAIIRSVKGLP